jgi:DNA-binding transcriptional ArsR family regulator
MDAEDLAVSRIAAAIGEPARVRILYCLLDNRARTSTELAAIAEVSPSTASAHLSRLSAQRLVKVHAQGRHKYYRLEGSHVARVLEGLSVLAGGARPRFVPHTPSQLRAARTCYDHIAGALGVAIHDQLLSLGHLRTVGERYEVTKPGGRLLADMGVDVDGAGSMRRRFAYSCLDWSERRSHLGGALAAALLSMSLQRRWVTQELDSRALSVTMAGRRELTRRMGIIV